MKTEEAEVEPEEVKIEEIEEPMKIDNSNVTVIPMNGMQVINIPIIGNATIINPLMIQSSSGSSGSEIQDQQMDAQ